MKSLLALNAFAWLGGGISLGFVARREADGWKLVALELARRMLSIMDGGDAKKVDAILLETITKVTGKPADKLWDPPSS